MQTRIINTKLDNITATEAPAIVTTNSGCQMHISGGLKARVLHIAQLLDEAMTKDQPAPLK